MPSWSWCPPSPPPASPPISPSPTTAPRRRSPSLAIPACRRRSTRSDLANQQAVGPFFAQYPELLPLYNGFVAASEPLAQRYTDLLASFLPILKRERKAQQALSDISGAIGQDASFATALLQDADVIHASGDPTSAAVVDLTGVEAGGLSARIHLDGNPAGANPQAGDISSAIQFAQIAVLSGALTVGATVTTLIDGVAVPYVVTATDVDFPTLAGSVAKAINTATAIDPKSGAADRQRDRGERRRAGGGADLTVSGERPHRLHPDLQLVECRSGLCADARGRCPVPSRRSCRPGIAGVLPAGNGGGPLALSLTGYVVAPQDGAFRFQRRRRCRRPGEL